MIAESGLQRSNDVDDLGDTLETALGLGASNTHRKTDTNASIPSNLDSDDMMDTNKDTAQLNALMGEVEAELKAAIKEGDVRRVNELRQKKEDVARLKRVEQVYVGSILIKHCWLPTNFYHRVHR